MGILDRLRNLISRQKPLQLPQSTQFNKTDLIDKTMPFITIDAIVSLINDKAIFDKFMQFDKNQDFFKDLTPGFIAQTVKTYVDFMNDKGAKFDKSAQKRINLIERFLPKDTIDRSMVFKDYKGVNKTSLYNAAISIVSNQEEFNKFLQCQHNFQQYGGIPNDILSDYISTELYDFTRKIASNSQIETNIGFVMNKQNTINQQKSYRVNPRLPINPDFEKSIFGSIKPCNDPAEYALQLYNELNKRVKYNPAFFALDQDLTDQFSHDIYYKPFNETTLQDNSLICKQWSELYAYFLEKSGFEAYVCGNGKHKNVKAFYGTNMIEADATNQTTSPDDPSRLTDLTRSKLGVRPAGFKAYNFFRDKKATKDISTIRLNYGIADFNQNRGATDQLFDIINLIGEQRNCTDLIMGLNDPNSEVGSIMKKIGFISDMLRGSSLDNMDSVGYLNHLFHNTLTPNEKMRAHNTNMFYKNLYTNDCDMVPIISVNKASDPNKATIDDFLYFEYEQETHELKPITRERIIEKVVTGEYIQGRGKADHYMIPGIPEVTNLDFIYQARDSIREKMQRKEFYDATRGTAAKIYGTTLQDTAEIPTVDDGGR